MANLNVCSPVENDIPWVIEGMENYLVSPFQNVNVKQLFEISPWSLIFRQENESTAYAAFMDYPFENHFSTAWYQSIEKSWKDSNYCGVKSIFLHFLICERNVKLCLEEFLKVTFRAIPSLEWCCILNEGSKVIDSEIEELFHRDGSMESGEFQFWATHRSEYISRIGIRRKRSEDYLKLKNMFSQMYGPFKNDNLKKFTLDFLDYGEDKCPTYKYFTFDNDNTYIAIADDDDGEAVGFMYATTQRIDLDMLNQHIQLECVHGLRKKHAADKLDVLLDIKDPSNSEESSDEEDEVRELITNIIDEVALEHDVQIVLNDVLDEICEPTKAHGRRRPTENRMCHDFMTLINSDQFDFSNSHHESLIPKYIKKFNEDSLIRLINSPEFDPSKEIHMKMVLRLGKAIQKIEPDRMKEILNSDLFDPSKYEFSLLSVHVMSYMPEHKLAQFQISEIGHHLHERLKYKKAKEKEVESTKQRKRGTVQPKLSFKDTQTILHYTKNLQRKETPGKSLISEREVFPKNLKHIHYRNMGFISGVALRGEYRIQTNVSISKIKQPFAYEKSDSPADSIECNKEMDVVKSQKYPVPRREEWSFAQEIPFYNGGSNCYYVEQFAIEKNYEYQSLYLIMSGFEYFPRVDYCMLLLPYGTAQVPYLRSYFSTIPSRPFSDFEKELFVFHKAGFNRTYELRMYSEGQDLEGVKHLIQCSYLKEFLLKDLENCSNDKDKEMQAVVLISEEKVFGVAVVKKMLEIDVIRRKYDITDRTNMKYHRLGSQGLLLHCVIHPIFKYCSNVYLKEIMRLCQKSVLYYKIYPTHLLPHNASLWQSLCNILEHFLPLNLSTKASKIKKYIVINTKEENGDNNNKPHEDKYYSLCYTCTKIVLKDKHVISSRIVIVGDSDVALGTLESLIYRNDYKFTNIAIVTRHGVKGEFNLNDKCYSFLPVDTDYTKSKLDSLCLPVWVTMMKGDVVAIERRSLKLRTGSKQEEVSVGFEYLVICTDLEFQSLHVKKSDGQEDNWYSLLDGLRKDTYVIAKNASNVFTINNPYEAAEVLNWLWGFFLEKEGSKKPEKENNDSFVEMEQDETEKRIVIYGNSLEAYTALEVIISEKFPLSKLTFVKGPQGMPYSKFNSKFIEEAIDHVLLKSELDMYINATIDYNKEVNEVRSLDITTEKGTVRLECCALLLYHERSINYNTFKVLHRSPLSFTFPLQDSKKYPYLLTNSNFQTNINNIYAAGTTAEMHSEAGNSVRLEDCVYNKREAGMIVGENICKAINDFNATKVTFPVFTKPEITYAKLPNGYFYILITSPSSCFSNGIKEELKRNYRIEKLVLGNLRTGFDIIPSRQVGRTPGRLQSAESVAEDSAQEETNQTSEMSLPVEPPERAAHSEGKDLVEETRSKAEGDPREEQSNQDILSKENDLAAQKINEKDDKLKDLPDEPDYFAITFGDDEEVQTIECLTKMDIDVFTLKHLYQMKITDLYRVIKKVKDKEELRFCLVENWILQLDHVLFEDESIKPKKRGYNSYWRLGYPKEIKDRLNGFLNSFSSFKSENI